jgi:hypothetical protein
VVNVLKANEEVILLTSVVLCRFCVQFNSIQFILFHFPVIHYKVVNHMDIEIEKKYICIYKVPQGESM